MSHRRPRGYSSPEGEPADQPNFERRVVAASRAQHRKLNSLGLYRELREKGAFAFPPLPAQIISVATDELMPHEAAAAIHARVKRTLAAD